MKNYLFGVALFAALHFTALGQTKASDAVAHAKLQKEMCFDARYKVNRAFTPASASYAVRQARAVAAKQKKQAKTAARRDRIYAKLQR